MRTLARRDRKDNNAPTGNENSGEGKSLCVCVCARARVTSARLATKQLKSRQYGFQAATTG
jgi:hypothetical protein